MHALTHCWDTPQFKNSLPGQQAIALTVCSDPTDLADSSSRCKPEAAAKESGETYLIHPYYTRAQLAKPREEFVLQKVLHKCEEAPIRFWDAVLTHAMGILGIQAAMIKVIYIVLSLLNHASGAKQPLILIFYQNTNCWKFLQGMYDDKQEGSLS